MNLGLVEAADVEDGRLQQIANAAVGDDFVEIDLLIGEQLGPLRQAADVVGEVADVVGMQVPIGQRLVVGLLRLPRAVIQLVDQDGGQPLRQEQQRKTGGDDLVGFD